MMYDDALLEKLVSRADDEDCETSLPITIMVGGVIITGAILPRDEWLRQHMSLLSEKSSLTAFAKDFAADMLRHEPETTHIHLTWARIVTGGPAVPIDDYGLLRVPLSEVGAWTIGDLNPIG
ncbi:hypothetical protein SBI_03097 [Streptomyces bingchenggensis BCW-1]|uniref:Uncharacterized protein n=1 Tax=Streptomyces bingchenggensis (strain BCW-1) TaxID=749414 RepID=D7C6K1_STRBB|nr:MULTISPECIES: hypothetical protein [Streptomyces]ADI06218.1 hypothetical protein SBI_03097 [Streptomyces bingchenggensis BCW-1]